MTVIRTGTVALFFSALPFACGGGSSASPPASPSDASARDVTSVPESSTHDAAPDDATTMACVPGTSIACAGPLGCPGYQVCNASGTAFDPCDCPAPDGGAPVDAAHDAPVESSTGSVTLSGAVQKGPFILGSSVTLATLSATGSPTGQVFDTTTTDDLGSFGVTFDYRGYTDIAASGYYYDEVTGALSTSPITLRALYDVTSGGAQTAYVNIVTHLAHARALSLMSGGSMTLEAAESQAEGELVTALGVGGAGFDPGIVGVQASEVGGNTTANAYLFAVSAVLVQLAIEQAGEAGSLDGTLQELLDTIANDLVAGGSLPPGLVAELRQAEQDLDVDLTMDLFYYRLQAIGSSASAADLNLAIDSDGDGYRNAIDTCPLVANANQAMVPPSVLCKATRRTSFLPSNLWISDNIVVPGDWTNHGAIDLLDVYVANGTNSAAAGLLIGDGVGHFGSPTTVTMPKTSNWFPSHAYDVDKDGNLDLVAPSGWAGGTGGSSFGALRGFPDPAGVDGPLYVGVVLGDFNGDSIPDVARYLFAGSGNYPPGVGLVVSLGTGGGTFGPAQVVSTAGPGNSCDTFLFFSDINGDALADIVAVWHGNGPAGAVAFLSDGTGGFHSAGPVDLTDQGGYQGALGDFDGDGLLDVAAIGEPTAIAFGDGTGHFGGVSISKGTGLGLYGTMVAGDLNGDGRTDAVGPTVGNPQPEGVDVAISNGAAVGPGQLLRARPVLFYNSGDVLSWASAGADVNGDGAMDFVLLGTQTTGERTVQVFLGNYLQ